MKFCINCIYYTCKESHKPEFGKCARKVTISPVDGSPTPYDDLPYCSIERKNYETQDTCRMEANYFVAKEQSGSPFNVEPVTLEVNHV